MDSIRCDEAEYLIWKWRPVGMEANTTKKENAIRYGSSDMCTRRACCVRLRPVAQADTAMR